jgi:hypothetical protein
VAVLYIGLEENEIIEREGLPELVEESCMQHFVECLGDVKECCGTILFVFEGFVGDADTRYCPQHNGKARTKEVKAYSSRLYGLCM